MRVVRNLLICLALAFATYTRATAQTAENRRPQPPNVDVVIDLKSSGSHQIALRLPKAAKFEWVQYYQTSFDRTNFGATPSVTNMISPNRIYFFTEAGPRDGITATFNFVGIEISNMAEDPTLEVELMRNPFSPLIHAQLEISSTNISTRRNFKITYKQIPFGKHQINVLSNFSQ